MGAADAGPSAAANHLELRREPFVQPDREHVMPRHQAAVDGQLVDHLVGCRSQVDRASIQIQEHRLTCNFTVDPGKQRLCLGPADRSHRARPRA